MHFANKQMTTYLFSSLAETEQKYSREAADKLFTAETLQYIYKKYTEI